MSRRPPGHHPEGFHYDAGQQSSSNATQLHRGQMPPAGRRGKCSDDGETVTSLFFQICFNLSGFAGETQKKIIGKLLTHWHRRGCK